MMRRICERFLIAALAVCVGTGAAAAQATVAGTISLEERPGTDPGDLHAAVVYLEPVGGAMAVSSSRGMREAAIDMRGREFIPHVQIVLVGGTVAFPNEDPFSHNVFSNTELGPFDLGLYRRGERRSASFPRPGVYPIYCNIHSRMVSFVVAVPNALAVQPDGAGRFSLHNVPAGAYVLHAWHERGASEVRRTITVPASGVTDVRLAIDARTYVAAPHLNKFGRPYEMIRADRY